MRNLSIRWGGDDFHSWSTRPPRETTLDNERRDSHLMIKHETGTAIGTVMARPLSDDRRNTIIMAATELIASRGLGTSTADIAKHAGISNGSVFTYFKTKTELFNALYSELKEELIETVVAAVPNDQDERSQLRCFWLARTHWGVMNPEKRKVLAQLHVSDKISETNRRAATVSATPILNLINQAAMRGTLRAAPRGYVLELVEGMASTTMDFMIANPATAEEASLAGFDALWRMLT
jgi:AcrR family transcriptional regulator